MSPTLPPRPHTTRTHNKTRPFNHNQQIMESHEYSTINKQSPKA